MGGSAKGVPARQANSWGAAAGMDRKIIVWDVMEQKRKGVLLGHQSGIRQLAYSTDHDLLLSAGFGNDAMAWDLASKHEVFKYVHLHTLQQSLANVLDQPLQAERPPLPPHWRADHAASPEGARGDG